MHKENDDDEYKWLLKATYRAIGIMVRVFVNGPGD